MKVVISRKVPDKGVNLLRDAGMELDYHDSTQQLPTDELKARCRDADALWCLLDDNIDATFMESCSNLQVVANYAVGYENIDLESAQDLGITVTNTPDVLSDATADFAFALLLTAARRVIEGHQYLMDRKDQGGFEGWASNLLLGSKVSGRTLGVVGAGRIGSIMARRGIGFDMEVLYHSRSEKPELDEMGCKFVDLDTIIETSDFLSLHLPLNDETEYIIDRKRLLQMKPNAYLVNTGRGKLIEENDLVEVMKQGHLAGAALDVFENEPKVHPGLYELDNVVITPHIASATVYARQQMSYLCGKAIVDVSQGKTPSNQVV